MLIIAHRGSSSQAPENTFAAFELAWEQSADGIELDVHLSADHRIMVHHDASTLRCCGKDLRIAVTDSDELRKLSAGRWKDDIFADERMPFLEEVLSLTPTGKHVLIEIKCGAKIIPALKDVLAETDLSRIQINLISFDVDVLIACQQAFPKIPCFPVIDAAKSDQEGRVASYSPDLIEQAKQHGFAGLDPAYIGLDTEFVDAVHAAGLQLFTWTVNDPVHAPVLFDMGVDAIASDLPLEMRWMLAKEKERAQ